jgi:hypothetical protein
MLAMRAENDVPGCRTCDGDDVQTPQTWSDRIIREVEMRTGFILEGREVIAFSLPQSATIGLRPGAPDWAVNWLTVAN